MGKKLFVLFINLLFTVNSVYALNAVRPGLLEVDFGQVIASQPVHQIRKFSIPVNGAIPDGVSIETSGMVNYQNNERIPSERITLFLNDKTVVMGTAPQMVEFGGKLENKKLEVRFDLDLEPLDYSGVYQGIIQFKFWEMAQNHINWLDQIQISLKVQVESWICLKTETTFIRLEPESPLVVNKNLANSEPLVIQVASNSNWQLGLSITSNDKIMKNISLFINVDDSSKQYQGTGQVSITILDVEKLIALGPSTVSEKDYWREIPVDLYMNDYTKYGSGVYSFNVHFFGEVVKP